MGKLARIPIQYILKENLSRATVFEFFSIDYPQFLDNTLEQVADMYGINPAVLEDALIQVQKKIPDFDYDFLELPVLIAYLKHTHHEYTKAKIPHIRRNLERLNETAILHVFQRFSRDMQKHMMLEEKIIFPFALTLVELNEEFDLQEARALLQQHSTEVLSASHTIDDDEMRDLRVATNNYTFSDDDPIVYQVVMTDLARLEEDIYRHAHIEDQILFRKARREEILLKERMLREERKN
ncbi:MAG TPA: hypothetical protein DIW47_05825 [Bacteroidetes bacterium]|nr:hypothetical protein [Bacteroidota bacterium]